MMKSLSNQARKEKIVSLSTLSVTEHNVFDNMQYEDIFELSALDDIAHSLFKNNLYNLFLNNEFTEKHYGSLNYPRVETTVPLSIRHACGDKYFMVYTNI